jgi:hypothetical protein
MRKVISVLLVIVTVSVGMAQKTKNAQQPKNNASEKIIKLEKVLFVYPEDLGFVTRQEADQMCAKINAQKMHGHNDWRLPSQSELSMIYENKDKVSGLVDGYYLTGLLMINEWGNVIGYPVLDLTIGNRQWRRADGTLEDCMPVNEKANVRLVRSDI